MRIFPSSDTSVVIEFGERINRDLNDQVLAAHRAIAGAGLAGFIESVPTFRSLMIHYDPLETTSTELIAATKPLLTGQGLVSGAGRLWQFPICYEGEHAPDLEAVAAAKDLSTQEVIKLHQEGTYHVYMIGFLPGFPYMGDLDEALQLPRRDDPRTRVPAGSVAIATGLTVIYPTESPGGWHLVGASPVPLFDAARPRPALLEPGDKVQFQPVSRRDFSAIKSDVEQGIYAVESMEAST